MHPSHYDSENRCQKLSPIVKLSCGKVCVAMTRERPQDISGLLAVWSNGDEEAAIPGHRRIHACCPRLSTYRPEAPE